ncbi:unnamed protein product [Rotaria socialis]|uniref:Late endosomal/lysosomal adaptor and MAPK and MTOR activator 5 n=1 Tax=Rotaria socialis TaxID=392032 RepID=A0A819CDN7_9BILA|nr:unnamed protein product [Rotaria socialis]CAF3378094.1 unnamed protein product [Rotaria socialis]CAF3421989.1 unnamed protein product [Rotaria socialis]CAF3568489.1 unnamed protein product [Rotaria socialis]CAF3810727.1 unnamed protein product [Rotaria socialis]
MEKKFETLIDNTIEKFNMVGVEIKGILVCDQNGLPLASKDVSISPGPIALLSQLASSLSGQRTTVCLENSEAQVLLHQTDKTVVAVYTKHAT